MGRAINMENDLEYLKQSHESLRKTVVGLCDTIDKLKKHTNFAPKTSMEQAADAEDPNYEVTVRGEKKKIKKSKKK